jgi:parvulin-like peptidyl-prolyl isomerase
MWQKLGMFCVLSALLVLVGCGAKEQTVSETAKAPDADAAMESASASVPKVDKVTVQHILIAFKGSIPNKDVTRTEDEARELAIDVFEKAKTSGDFGALVKEYTDDSYPGIYAIVNNEADANPEMQIFARTSMVPSFGDVSFGLDVGEVGLARYDPKKSKYGWHIIKRLR